MKSNTLTSIPVQVTFSQKSKLAENNTDSSSEYNNVRSILVEVQQGLENFYKTGNKRIIDLGSIPLAPFEKVKLIELLGRGEVFIHLSALGESEIYETLFACVWIVKHHDEQGEVSALLIEISEVPDIILSQIDDIAVQTNELKELINKL
jgi:HupH hydrogenase expression protein